MAILVLKGYFTQKKWKIPNGACAGDFCLWPDSGWIGTCWSCNGDAFIVHLYLLSLMQLMFEVQLDLTINHDFADATLHLQVKESYARSLIRRSHVADSELSALDRIYISLERNIRCSASPLLCVGKLSFLGLSGVYCKQQCSCTNLAFWWVQRQCDLWLFNGCYHNHKDIRSAKIP